MENTPACKDPHCPGAREISADCLEVCDHSPRVRYQVKYYDRAQSRKGRGTQIAVFAERADAEAFAARNRIYSRPCTVVEVSP